MGTTTICGGILLEIDDDFESASTESEEEELRAGQTPVKDRRAAIPESPRTPRENGRDREKDREREREKESYTKHERESEWVFVCASIGDCKAIRYSRKENKLITITCKLSFLSADQ